MNVRCQQVLEIQLRGNDARPLLNEVISHAYLNKTRRYKHAVVKGSRRILQKAQLGSVKVLGY